MHARKGVFPHTSVTSMRIIANLVISCMQVHARTGIVLHHTAIKTVRTHLHVFLQLSILDLVTIQT